MVEGYVYNRSFFSAIRISLIADTHLSLTVVYSGTSLSVSELSTIKQQRTFWLHRQAGIPSESSPLYIRTIKYKPPETAVAVQLARAVP